MTNSEGYLYLKLGGSLITHKDIPLAARKEVIQRLANEIALFRKENPSIKLILGHGSGSFGHSTAKKYGTVEGVETKEEWVGYTDVWYQARFLNQLVIIALHEAGIPVVSIDISNFWISNQQKTNKLDIEVIGRILSKNILPVVYGNVLLDNSIGGTIFSTEKIFAVLSEYFPPQRILLAGIEDGIWEDYPTKTILCKKITPKSLSLDKKFLQGSINPDVTGGMYSKVETLLPLLDLNKNGEVFIFNGLVPDAVKNALLNKNQNGTILINDSD